MRDALRVLGRAFGAWWGHLGEFALFNLAWVLLQIPIVTGPPATAALYVIARHALDGDLLDWRDGWRALRQMWWPAWRWGLVNLIVLVGLVGNFYFYQNQSGWGWIALRLAWGGIGVVWLAANLFYWPFWLAQTDRRLTVTLRNSLLFIAKAPVFSLTLVAFSVALIIAGALVTLPFIVAAMAWVALLSTLAVDVALKTSLRPAAPEPAVEIELT